MLNVYSDLPDISVVTPRGPADAAFFAEAAALFDKHGVRDRFDLTLLHKHFDIADGEILCEETDEASRLQTITPIKAGRTNVIETAWRLGENGEALISCVCSGGSSQNHDHVSVGG